MPCGSPCAPGPGGHLGPGAPVRLAAAGFRSRPAVLPEDTAQDWPSNLWMGVSVEDASTLSRVDDLRAVPAAARFLSCEPLIGPLDGLDLAGIDWLIIGGESGSDARRMDVQWVRDLLRKCQQPGVSTAPFVKQLGSVAGRELGAGSKGGDWERWPEDLRFRRFPSPAGTAAAS